MVDDSASRLLELEAKVENLERALASQRLIGVVIGLIAQRYQCTTDHAWAQLSKLSQVSNIKVRDVARMLVDAFDEVSRDGDSEALAGLLRALPDGSWGAPVGRVAEPSTNGR